MRNTLGPSWMPAPISLNSGACSSTCTGMPLRDSASAVAKPADAAADDQNGGLIGVRTHVALLPDFSDIARTLEHDAETWEAPPREDADMKKLDGRMAGARAARCGARRRRRRPSPAGPSPSCRRRRPAASPTSSAARWRSASARPGASRPWSRTSPAPTTSSPPNTSSIRRPTATRLFIAPDSTFIANPSLYPKLPYDPVQELHADLRPDDHQPRR